MPPVPVLSPAESDAWDARAEEAGIARATLMESAGRAAAVVLARRFGGALGRGVVIAAGTGNNGGDGWVLARALRRQGARVWVASAPGSRSPLSAAAAERALAEGVAELPADGPWPAPGLAVDALLGTGARGAPRPPVAALLERLRDLQLPIVALDGPTGLDLGTGVVHAMAHADLSITFGGVRRGHLLARDEVGEIVVVDIGHPPAGPLPLLVSSDWASRHFPRFRADAHKGTRGRVLVLGGAPGMSGALRLAARAAFAAGAGYVHGVAPRETIAELRQAEPDLLTLAQSFDAPPSDELRELAARADCIVAGPGYGRGDGRADFLRDLLRETRAHVLDADALTAFQGAPERLAELATRAPTILTPHPGEFRALLPMLASEREVDPWHAAAAGSTELQATLLLKGVPSVIARDGRALWTVAAGNPGLGSGGSGDVLSGIAGTLLAQRVEPDIAAALAALALGMAGDIAARRVTAHAMRPMDVIQALPDVWREWGLASILRSRGGAPIIAELPAPAAI